MKYFWICIRIRCEDDNILFKRVYSCMENIGFVVYKVIFLGGWIIV